MRRLLDIFGTWGIAALLVAAIGFFTLGNTADADGLSIAYPILLDASGEVGRMYDAKTTPHMFVIGAEGELLYDGAIDDDAAGKSESPTNFVEAALTSALAGQPVETAQTKPYGCSVKYAEKDKGSAAS